MARRLKGGPAKGGPHPALAELVRLAEELELERLDGRVEHGDDDDGVAPVEVDRGA